MVSAYNLPLFKIQAISCVIHSRIAYCTVFLQSPCICIPHKMQEHHKSTRKSAPICVPCISIYWDSNNWQQEKRESSGLICRSVVLKIATYIISWCVAYTSARIKLTIRQKHEIVTFYKTYTSARQYPKTSRVLLKSGKTVGHSKSPKICLRCESRRIHETLGTSLSPFTPNGKHVAWANAHAIIICQ